MRMCSRTFHWLLVTCLTVAAVPVQGCDTECCQSGGYCASPVFVDCNGSWDYKTSCSPSYDTCCMSLATDTTMSDSATQKTTQAEATTSKTTQVTSTGQPIRSTSDSYISYPPPVSESCGQRMNSDPRIVGGSDAQEKSWLWIAQLQRDYFGWDGWEHFCGATLISDRWAVTAAHCVAKYNEADPAMFRVVLGEHDRTSSSGNEVIAYISRIIVHEDWSADVRGSASDLALLELTDPVLFNDYIQPACLPAYTNEDFTQHDQCWISGWGDTKGTGNSNILQEVKINITSYEECRQKWLTGTGGKDYVKRSHVCVGNGVPGACNGDSGGPLVCLREGRHVLVGATSFGAAGCQETDAPNVYTKISHFLPWIFDKINTF